jgi:hypothetical protein
MSILHSVEHVLGLRDSSSNWSSFWGGFGSDIPEFAIFVVLWRKINCHAKGCPRIGLHKVDGTPYVTCRKHHPVHAGSVPATAAQIAQAHADAHATGSDTTS